MFGLNFVLRWRSGSRTVATKRNESRSNNTKRPFSVQPNEFQCKCWFERMVRCGQEVDRIISQDWIQHSYPFIGIRCVKGLLICPTLLLIIGLSFIFSPPAPNDLWLELSFSTPAVLLSGKAVAEWRSAPSIASTCTQSSRNSGIAIQSSSAGWGHGQQLQWRSIKSSPRKTPAITVEKRLG